MAISTAEQKNPLPGFEKLNDIIHVYKPVKAHDNNKSTGPGLIIFCSWAWALPKHISKYLRGYQERFPTSQILLLQTDTGNLLWRPDAWQMPMYYPAVAVISQYLDELSGTDPKILLHALSNGGSHSAVQLTEAYRGSAEDFPISAIVLDSCPSPPHFEAGATAMTSSFPKDAISQFFAKAICYATLGPFAVLHQFGVEFISAKAYRELNCADGPFIGNHVPRAYIYSKTDSLIPADDVLAHAEGARRSLKEDQGQLVSTEDFGKSPHVNHISLDPERYWRIVRETWEKSRR